MRISLKAPSVRVSTLLCSWLPSCILCIGCLHRAGAVSSSHLSGLTSDLFSPKFKMLKKIVRLVQPRKKVSSSHKHAFCGGSNGIPTLLLFKEDKLDMHPMSTAVFPLMLGSPQVCRFDMRGTYFLEFLALLFC